MSLKTTVSTYRPYFAPFPGFFAKAMRSDVLVLLDTVQFPLRATWLTRNRFKNDQGIFCLRSPVWRKGKGLQRIQEVRLCHERNWRRKHLESLKAAYGQAPFFDEHENFLQNLYAQPMERLVDFNRLVLQYLMDCLGMQTEVRWLSELGIEEKEPRLSLEIALAVGARRFLVASHARKFLDPESFQKAGLEMAVFTPRVVVYPQLWGSFASNLSALDLLLNCGPKAADLLRRA